MQLSHQCQRDVWSYLMCHPVYQLSNLPLDPFRYIIASLRTPVQPIITISLPSLLRYRRSWTCRRPTSLPCWACPTRRSGRSTARRGARSTAQGEAGTATPGRRSTPSQSPTSRRSTLWQWSVYYRDRLKGLYVVPRSFFLLLLTCSAWPCLVPA